MRSARGILSVGIGMAIAVTLVGVAPMPSSVEALPNPSPSPTDEPTPTPSPTVDPTPAPSPTVDPAPSPTPSPTVEPEPCVLAPYTGCAEADLSGRDLRGVNLTGANLIRATLDRAVAAGATMDSADLLQAHAVGIGLQWASLVRTDFTDAALAGADLTGAVLTNAVLTRADLTGATITGADFTGANLSGATWVDGQVCARDSVGTCNTPGPDEPTTCEMVPFASCADADLADRDLRGVNLTGANLARAVLDRADAAEATLTRASAVSSSLYKTNLNRAVLTGADLSNAQLISASARRISAAALDASWADLSSTDFTGANLDDADLSASRAVGAAFAGATLTSADLSATNLTRADLSGADLTNAVLRRADLQGATVTGVTWKGADVSGATWTDGRICAEGSIGRCVVEVDDVSVSRLGIVPVWDIIAAGATISNLIGQCATNIDAGQGCFDSSARNDLKKLRGDIADLRAQMERNQLAVTAALAAIIAEQKGNEVKRQYDKVKRTIDEASLATRKYNELANCLAVLDTPGSFASKSCTLTDKNGNGSIQWSLADGVTSLYAGSGLPVPTPGSTVPKDWTPFAELADGGPVARLLYATAYTYAGERRDYWSVLQGKGVDLQRAIAGSGTLPRDGLLESTLDWTTAELALRQATSLPSKRPAFLPGTYLQAANNWVEYYLQVQAQYYTPVVAALSLLGRSQDVQTIKGAVENGVDGKTHVSLPAQEKTWSIPLSDYRIDTTSLGTADTPDRVALVVGTNGKLYRVQHVYGGATRASVYPDFDFPSFSSLDEIQKALAASGVKMSTVQSMYPSTLPGGYPSAWWAHYSRGYKVVEVRNVYPRPGSASQDLKTWTTYTVPYDAPASGKFGDNVTWISYETPCAMPVRMWNERPDFSTNSLADGPVSQQSEGSLVVKKQKGGSGTYSPDFRFAQAYDQIVTTGAAPAFDLVLSNDNFSRSKRYYGEGVLFRCDGRTNVARGAKQLSADFVSVTTAEPQGFLKYLSR